MSLGRYHLSFLALWLIATDGVAQQNNTSLYDPDDATNWYQVEIVVFLNDFKTVSPTEDDEADGSDGSKEVLWHKKAHPLATSAYSLIPVQGIERRPQTLGELNSLMYSSEYAPDIRTIPMGSTVELEDTISLLQAIKPLHNSADSLAAIAEPDSLGQYWPYIKPLEISGSTLDKAIFDSFDFKVEEEAPLLESKDGEPIIRVAADKALRRLPNAELQLRKMAQRIKKSANYRLLTHQSWYQPVPPRGSGLPILLGIAGKDNNGNQVNTFLTGTVTVERGRFLHAYVDLQYIVPIEPIVPTEPIENEELDGADASAPSTAYMTLNTWVKMRSDEVHYLDHPHLNALILLTPYQPEDVEGLEQ